MWRILLRTSQRSPTIPLWGKESPFRVLLLSYKKGKVSLSLWASLVSCNVRVRWDRRMVLIIVHLFLSLPLYCAMVLQLIPPLNFLLKITLLIWIETRARESFLWKLKMINLSTSWFATTETKFQGTQIIQSRFLANLYVTRVPFILYTRWFSLPLSYTLPMWHALHRRTGIPTFSKRARSALIWGIFQQVFMYTCSLYPLWYRYF